jgi:CoA:oxalate CoA-transferase
MYYRYKLGAPTPYEGLLVVDLTQVVSGPVATMLLADLGASVVKIEPPGGEPYRRSGLPIETADGSTNLNFLRFSRGKKSVTLDLKSDEGRGVLERLVGCADVLVENFRPGVLERLGFSAERLAELNPRLVYASVSGYGHGDLFPAPYARRPAYAIVVEALAGLTHLAGERDGPPTWMGFAMADIYAGTLAVAGISTALYARERSGHGGRVDISMYDGAVIMNDLAVATHAALGDVLDRGGYAFQSPWGPFAANDGWVVVAVLSEVEWHALCGVIDAAELADDARLQNGSARAERFTELVEPPISRWTATRSRLQCADELLAAGVPAAPVNSAVDLATCEQLLAREMLVDVDDPVVGSLRLVGNPIKLRGVPSPEARSIPRLGEHTDEVLRDILGLEATEVEALRAAGAFGVEA